MKKRHLQNCLSRERSRFESNVKKYKRLIEMERGGGVEISQTEYPVKLESLAVINQNFISEPVASTSVDGLFSNHVEGSEVLITDSVSIESGSKTSALVADHKVKCEEIKSWAFRNKISETALQDLLCTLKMVGVQDLPLSAKDLLDIQMEPLPESSASPLAKSEDILSVLTKINARLENLEQNQSIILQNQTILNAGQATIVANQQQTSDFMEKCEAAIPKAEMMAQTTLLMECKVAIKEVEQSVCRMTGECHEKITEEVVAMLPLRSVEGVEQVEEKLKSYDFAQAMITYLEKIKGSSDDVSRVIRAIFTDGLLDKYNWEGRRKKHSLGNLLLIGTILRDVFQQQDAFEYEKSVRKALGRSHNRTKQKKHASKTKN